MRTVTLLVVAFAAAVTALAVLAPLVAPAGEPCSSCHFGSNPAGAYVFRTPAVSPAFPSVAPPGTPITYTLKLAHAGDYTVKNPGASIDVQGAGALAGGESASRELASIGETGGSGTVAWRLMTGNLTGTIFINATVQFTARWRHTSDGESDDYPYMLRVRSTVSVRPVAMYAGTVELLVPAVAGRSATFELVSYAGVKNITLSTSPNLDGVVSVVPVHKSGLDPGERYTVRVNAINSRVVDNGRLDIVWENLTGVKDATFVVIRTVDKAPGPEPENPVRWMGRFTGLLSLGLLISSVVLGYVKRGGARRVRVHCAISWFILGLSVYHGIMLVWGPYKLVWLGNWVLLGYLSAAMMGVSSVNGLLEGWMTRKLSRRAWLGLHRAFLLSAIVLVIVHAVMIGTDLRFVREALLPEHLGSGRGREEVIGLLGSFRGW